MNPEDILIVDDVERPRLASELSDWWLGKHYLFDKSKAGKNYARLGKALSKEFYEEIHPLVRFMEKLFPDSSGVRCSPKIGNQSYDALITMPDGSQKKIEVTFAKDGYAESAQMERLITSGTVNITFPPVIQKEKGRKREVDFIEDHMRDRSDLIDEIVKLIEEQVTKKIKRQYEAGVILVIGFDDSRLDASDDNRVCDKLRRRFEHEFDQVYLVGIQGRIFCPKPLR